jgi:hypothetical protein
MTSEPQRKRLRTENLGKVVPQVRHRHRLANEMHSQCPQEEICYVLEQRMLHDLERRHLRCKKANHEHGKQLKQLTLQFRSE